MFACYQPDAITMSQSPESQLQDEQLAQRYWRHMEYALLGRIQGSASAFFDRFVSDDIDPKHRMIARAHAYSLCLGLVIMPLFCLTYWLLGGRSVLVFVLLLAPFWPRWRQLQQLKTCDDIDNAVSQRIFGFVALITSVAAITGGLMSPLTPWLLCVISQTTMTHNYAIQRKGLMWCSVAISLISISGAIGFPNYIPESARQTFLNLSVLIIVSQLWLWHYMMLKHRDHQLTLIRTLERERQSDGLIPWAIFERFFDQLRYIDIPLTFLMITLDVSEKNALQRQFQLTLNRKELLNICHRRFSHRCIVIRVSDENILLMLFDEPATFQGLADDIRREFRGQSQMGCSLEISGHYIGLPADLSLWKGDLDAAQ